MTLTQKKLKTETFRIVGEAKVDRTILDIAIEIECLCGDLLSNANEKRSCRTNAETIMYLCADILVMSKT
jgi:hypothetical protein